MRGRLPNGAEVDEQGNIHASDRPLYCREWSLPKRAWDRIRVWWLRMTRRRTPSGGSPGPDGPRGAGVREPRRPGPLAGAGAIALPEPEGVPE